MPTLSNRIKRGGFLYWAALLTLSAAIIRGLGVLFQVPQSALLVACLLLGVLVQVSCVVAVAVRPVRRMLLASGAINGLALLLWVFAHTTGLPVGLTIWHAELSSIEDLWLPIIEGTAACLFFSLAARTWNVRSRFWRGLIVALPYLFLVGVVALVQIKSAPATLFMLAIFTVPGTIPDSLQLIFLPLAGLVLLFLLTRLVFARLRARTPRAGLVALALLPILLVTTLLSWPAVTEGASNAAWFQVSDASPVSAPAGQTTTLEYCHPDGDPLALDLSEPAATFARPVPIVFYIHGGEGTIGNRQLSAQSSDDAYFARLLGNLLAHGFAVGSIDYRLAPLGTMVEQVREAKCAVRFLRAHAHDLGIDSQRIGVYGVSEGGYLSAMLGLAGPGAGFDQGQYLDQSSRVQAVIDMWGPADLSDWSGSPSWVYTLGQGLGIYTASDARYASPVSYVTPNAPPFLIVQGADDWFIRPHHSQKLAHLLQAAHVPTTLIMIQHDQHGLVAPTPGQIEQPSPDTVIQTIQDFFIRTLGA